MTPAALALVLTTASLNVVLWLSYAVLRLSERDFGRVSGGWRAYLLGAAAVAYACNLAFVALLAQRAPPMTLAVATVCVASYYGLQLLFVPFLRLASRASTRALLALCVVPMVVLAGLGVTQGPLLATLGVLVALHVTVNDAILYGFTF